MKDYLKNLVQQRGLAIALIFIMMVVAVNATLVMVYRNNMKDQTELRAQIQSVRNGITKLESHIWLGDLGVRAYLIKATEAFLNPYLQAKGEFKENLAGLENNLEIIGFDLAEMEIAKTAISNYMDDLQLIVDLVDADELDEALEIFYQDRGYVAWQQYAPFLTSANQYIDDLTVQNEASYNDAMLNMLMIQIFLILITIPVLSIVFNQLRKDKKFRAHIFDLIDKSNRKFLFDDGNNGESKDENKITSSLVSNLKKASNFINQVSKGNYGIEWEGMHNGKMELNSNTLAGELVSMRNQMKSAKEEDDIRIWINEGLSKFADLIRKHQHNIQELSEILISNVVQYLGAQQGGLFFVSEDEHKKEYLELMGCYAYQRKKFLEKRIQPGQGMVGQCYLEGETTYVTKIPQNYVNITSGLGDTRPKVLLIVPLKINEDVVGVIEIASLKNIEEYKIEFMERLAESIASSIASVKTNESTKMLLEQSQQQAEEMRAQEEEMRQNMEELQATQEQMHRKHEEVETLLKEAATKEDDMKKQMDQLAELQKELSNKSASSEKEAEDYRTMMMDILNEIPQKVFLKDADGKIFLANNKVADAHGLPLNELIGKSDYDFVDKKTADSWRKQELEIMKKGYDKYVVEDTIGGKKTVLESVKKVFNIRNLNQVGLLGIQNDITDRVDLEKQIEDIKSKS